MDAKGNDNAGQGRISALASRSQGPDSGKRQDIEVLYDNLPEPSISIRLGNRVIIGPTAEIRTAQYVNRAPMDAAPGKRKEPEIVFNHLMEGIGLSLDLANNACSDRFRGS